MGAGVLAVASAPVSAAGAVSRTAAACRVLTTPVTLGAKLLKLHRNYTAHQPNVRRFKVTGPAGHVYLGACGSKRYALASFDATLNGQYFGIQDQPERFAEPAGAGWRDLGNTGGDPCGLVPTALLKAWKFVRACPP